MKTFNITTTAREVQPDELSLDDRELIEAAREATARSYAPYSKFHVGAAIRMADGRIVTGSNQENAAYPSSMCAERTAAYWAAAQYPGTAMKK
ncbi:MAG: cytidine deaminase, partial [Muribaculaceae bacterium]|nr:cytidine deaminase [Muribaculaceae bacterium]